MFCAVKITQRFVFFTQKRGCRTILSSGLINNLEKWLWKSVAYFMQKHPTYIQQVLSRLNTQSFFFLIQKRGVTQNNSKEWRILFLIHYNQFSNECFLCFWFVRIPCNIKMFLRILFFTRKRGRGVSAKTIIVVQNYPYLDVSMFWAVGIL